MNKLYEYAEKEIVTLQITNKDTIIFRVSNSAKKVNFIYSLISIFKFTKPIFIVFLVDDTFNATIT